MIALITWLQEKDEQHIKMKTGKVLVEREVSERNREKDAYISKLQEQVKELVRPMHRLSD